MIARCCECGATFNRDRDEARKVNYTTREEWLVAAMRTLDDWAFKRSGHPIPPNVKVTYGWTAQARTERLRRDLHVKRLPASPTLTDAELDNAIRAAQRRRQRAHPDRGGTHENFSRRADTLR